MLMPVTRRLHAYHMSDHLMLSKMRMPEERTSKRYVLCLCLHKAFAVPSKYCNARKRVYRIAWCLQEVRYTCRCSMLEIYNESVYDLLNATGEDLDLHLKPRTEEVYVKGLSWEEVSTGME